jgi:serine/threonine protein kinase
LKVSTARYSERFQREAKAISALNHPNICTLHDVGPDYLVMELLEGSTLSDKVKDGPLDSEMVARFGAQIASALVEAHAKGVAHRDLKPKNIMITRHGVKLLDFGLARMAAEPGLTMTNAIMGTPAYMAPEQAEGRDADAPADLFSLGLVLYEMVSGRLPFPGASLGRMLVSGSSVTIEPPCRAGVTYASRWNKLILQLLEKDPAHRPQSAAAVHQELLELGRGKRRWSAALAVSAGTLGIAVAALWFFHPAGTSPQRWPEVSRVTMISTNPGNELTPSVSADGMFVAFSWSGPQKEGHQDIYMARLDGQAEPMQLTHHVSDTDDVFPAWSPVERKIAFVRRQGATSGKIIVIPVDSGPEREIPEIHSVARLAWTPDGKQIAFASASLESGRSTLFLIRLEDGRVRRLIVPPDGTIGDASPAFSPDGTSLAFVRWSSPSNSSLLVQKLGADFEPSGDPATVPLTGLRVDTPAWADNRRLLFIEGQRIQEWESGAAAQQIYLSSAQLQGLAIAGHDASGTPRLVTAQNNLPDPRIWMVPLRSAGEMGRPPVVLSRFGSDSNNPDFSKDGKHVAFIRRRGDIAELWMADADGRNAKPLTKMNVKQLAVPRWSPDNRHIAFFAKVTDQNQIYVVDTQDSSAPRQVTHENPGCILPTWSLDGKYLYCSRRIGGPELVLFRVPAYGDAQIEMEKLFDGKVAIETPDGRLLYIKDVRSGLFARSRTGDVANNPEEQLVNDIKGPIAYFVPVADGVYYTGKNLFDNYVALRYFNYARKTTVDVAPKSVTGPVNSLTISPDGNNLVYTQNPKSETDLTFIEFGSHLSR